MKRSFWLGVVILSLAVTISYANNPQNVVWDSIEYGDMFKFGQWTGPGYRTATPTATISVSTEVAHTGIQSVKVDLFTLGAYTSTYRRLAIYDKGDYLYWGHWSGGWNTLSMWCYIPSANWIPGLTGEFVFQITTTPYNIIGPPIALNTGWNYITVDMSSVRNQYTFPYTQENARWMGVRITNTNTTTAFSGPFYLDDYGGIPAPGIYYITTFETDNGVDPLPGGWGNVDAAFNSVPVTLDIASSPVYAGNSCLSATFSLAADTSTTYKAGWFKTLNCSYNLMAWVGLRCYLYYPTTPPNNLYTQFFAQVGTNDYFWIYVDQPGMQAGWNELVIDLSQSQYSVVSSRIRVEREGILLGQNTSGFDFSTTLYTDEVEAIPPIEATTTAVSWDYGTRNLSPYIQYGLPFGPLSAHYYLWESNNPSVAYIADSTSGIIEGASAGSAVITVRDRTAIGMYAVITANITIGTLVVSPPGPINLVGMGTTQSFTASVGTAPYSWSLSAPGVVVLDTTEGATVTTTAIGVGSVELTVTDSSAPTPQQVKVTINVGVEPLVIAPPGPIILSVGSNKQFTGIGGTEPYFWSLSNSTVGYISDTTGKAITFTATAIGPVDLIVTDSTPPTPQQTTVNITAIPTTAPVFMEADIPGTIVRMSELFE
jgi:hypothetical protein